MAIASSTIISERTQADGKVRTIELHVTDAGTEIFIEYDRAPGASRYNPDIQGHQQEHTRCMVS